MSLRYKIEQSRLFLFFSKKLSLLQNKLAPGWAHSKVDALLITPRVNRSSGQRAQKGFSSSRINTPDGSVQCYQTGQGPVVAFVHGWGGSASQFFPLMRGLTRCGFTALAFDQLGHGQSDDKPASIQQSIATTNFILHSARNKNKEGLVAIVAHATGCITVVNARSSLIKNTPLFLISPIFNYRLFLLKRLMNLNIHAELLKKHATRLTKNYKRDYEKFDLARNLTKYSDITVIAHDQSDAESPISDSVKFCTKYPLTKLLVTREFDHNRVINSESVWQELKSHLNYEDTTINFTQEILKRPVSYQGD